MSVLLALEDANRLTADEMLTYAVIVVLLLGIAVVVLMKRWYGA